MSAHPEPIFEAWLAYFAANPVRQREIESEVDWSAGRRVAGWRRHAFARSFQRFELGESGDGHHLLRAADRAGDPAYAAAILLFVAEEQRHSQLFGRGLRHLGARSLSAHWSDAAFRAVRRLLGLDTEIALFLIAETVAVGYFHALAGVEDPVLAGIGRRIATDENEHVRFQVDRLHADFHGRSVLLRLGLRGVWTIGAVAASLVFVVGHRQALRACGRSPRAEWVAALRRWRAASRLALRGGPFRPVGPTDLAAPAGRPSPA